MQDNLQKDTPIQNKVDRDTTRIKYPFWKWLSCYGLSLLLVSIIIFGLTETALKIIQSFELAPNLTASKMIIVISVIYFVWSMTKNLGDHWRSTENAEIGTAVTGFPNPFFDPHFIKGSLLLQRKYNKLYSKYYRKEVTLRHSQKMRAELEKHVNLYVAKLKILLRHNDNVNRLIRSFNFLFIKRDRDFPRKMLREILSECITVLEHDHSDKSITLFQIDNAQLKIVESVRINAESIDKRVFKKGEGFAGHVWKTGKAEIVNQINENDERFNDFNVPTTPIGSILGFPLKVDQNIYGVLCLQSEEENNFNTRDLRTVEFYARFCTMIILYDKIKTNKSTVLGGD